MFPILLILVGLAVLIFGRRLAVLGAAVGGLVGLAILHLFPGISDFWVQLGIVAGLAIVGFVFGGFARGIVDVVILVLSALAGAAIVLSVLDLFNSNFGVMDWVLAVVGAVVAVFVIRRFRRGRRDWGLIILAGLVGALLVTRGLVLLLPSLQGPLSTLIAIVLVAGGIGYQGGQFDRFLKKAPGAAAPTSTPPPQNTDGPTQPPSGQ
ncbi:MAG: hypothetical protein U0822_02525 [Anaerolineae bacterium]